jgi:hypothetical protein
VRRKIVISKSRIGLILGASLALSLVAGLLYAVTVSSVLLYLAWGLLLPVLVCFFLLNTVRFLRYPARSATVHHRYYISGEDGMPIFEDAYWGEVGIKFGAPSG